MIIKSSNVYMGSQRNYQRNVKSQTTTTKWQPANPARMSSTTQSYSYSYSEGEQYNNYNSFARNLKNSRQNSLQKCSLFRSFPFPLFQNERRRLKAADRAVIHDG